MEISEISADNLASLNAQGYTEGDLSMLAKSEVDALLAVPADDSGSDDSGSDPHAAAAAAQDDADAVAAAAAASGKPAAAAEDDAGAAPAPTSFVPMYSAEVPANAKEQLAALAAEEAEAFKKLMDGIIDSDEYQTVRTRTEEAKDELKTKALTASIFEQANTQAAEQTARTEWNRAETSAFTSFKSEGLDYKGKPALLAAYNTNLKALGADPKNENRDAAWFLTEAHRITKEDLGFTAPKPTPKVPNRVDPAEIPPTLRSVPVAATGAVNADEFAHMRNLDGIALERAHAKLTNEQRDRWMAE